MYIPKAFEENRLEVLHDAIERVGLATLVTATANGLMASHIPLLLDRDSGEFGTLLGHVAIANNQWRESLPDTDALAIFVGPDAYISPTWYASKAETGRVVPTWNYVAVHCTGPATFFQDQDRLLKLVTRLTGRHEAAFPKPWQVADAPQAFIEGQLRAIVGLELPIRKIEGKWKMSQNRTLEDRRGVVRGLGESEVGEIVANTFAGRPDRET
jgi:transcriptional regulator